MKVKTNFKKMFLVDNFPINNKTQNEFNENTILNKYIESQNIDNDDIRNKILDNENQNENEENTENQINYEDSSKKITKNDENKDENEKDGVIENKEDTNDSNEKNDITENNDSASCKKPTKDFNLGKCLDDCFKKSSIKYDQKNLNETNHNLNIFNDNENDNENDTALMEIDNEYDNNDNEYDNDERELLERLERIRNNEKILKSKQKRLLDRPPKLKRLGGIRNLKGSILSKYKHQNYLPKRSLQSYINKKKIINKENRNDSIKKLYRIPKRKLLPDEESFVEAKRRKIIPPLSNESEESQSESDLDFSGNFDEPKRINTNANIKAIPLLNNESVDNDSDMNLDYSDNSDKDFESSIDDDEVEYEDIEENVKPYSLRQNRKKPRKYQDYIKSYLVCRNCEKEFRNEKALDNHTKTCKINSFACTICGKNYKTKWGLQSHLNNMHSRKQNKNKLT